jgi:hypothetical protein
MKAQKAKNYTKNSRGWLLPNQSLKLTEVAVDDFAARCWTDLEASIWNVRATNYLAAAVRRRSLAPVR